MPVNGHREPAGCFGRLARMTTASIVPPPAAQHLSEVLELEQLDTNLFRSRVNQINNNRSLFGGQILGQGLKAAALTVEPGRRAHSLHGYFLLAGMSDIGVIYDVELTRDGGSFSTRRVVARQRAKPIFHMELSFHRQEQGFEHEIQLDVDVPEPDQLMSTRELATKFADRLPKSAQAIATQQAIVELKPVSPEDYFLRKAGTPRVLTHTVSMMSGQVMMASLDHAMWFHRPCRADDWVLIDAVSPFAGGARGLTRAQIFDRERRLVASVAQEGLVRPLEKKSG
jgi:acyl-CoA thioesterase-2